jgi:DNA polymerase III delta prime subunit
VPFYAAVIIPENFDCDFVETVLETICKRLPAHRDPNYLPRALAFECISKKSQSQKPWRHDSSRWVFALAHKDEQIPLEFRRVADATVRVRDIALRDVQSAVRYFSRQTIPLDAAQRALSLPLADLDIAIRRDRPIARVVDALRRFSDIEHGEKPESIPSVATLDTMPGYGAAAIWGKQLAEDLATWKRGDLPWASVDRGVLLAGPPGTGKTTFAQALAATCGVPLIASSASQWQAKGHLGDMLGAMFTTFNKARNSAPCVLLIDEIEAVGDRNTADRDHRDYLTRVIAGLLECLDGANSREGVVVVAATNYPDRIDAALCRPGRLDRRIDISLPSVEDRARILAFHGAELPEEELVRIAARTPGRSGAALELLVRSAQRRARTDNRALTAADIEAELPPLLPIPPEVRRRAAFHEAGHVLASLELGSGDVVAVRISSHIDPAVSEGEGGGTQVRWSPPFARTKQDYLDEIAVLLAGSAAEETTFGSRTDGAGGTEGSDLQRATALAVAMVGSVGLDEWLGYVAPVGSQDLVRIARMVPPIAIRVEAILKDQFDRAARILSERSAELSVLAEELLRTGALSRSEIDALLETPHRQVMARDEASSGFRVGSG